MKTKLKSIAKKVLQPILPGQTFSGDKTLDIAGLSLVVDWADYGGRQYQNRSSVEEVKNQLYSRLAEKFRPSVVVDVGANYGFTGSIFSRSFPEAELILIEPDPKLGNYIHRNMQANGVSKYRLIQSICSDKAGESVSFGINPSSSQDNRVQSLPGWNSVEMSSVTISEILSVYNNESVFIKVDTQGFETQVYKGAESYLSSSDNWFIKSEFAPSWLESQGNSPEELLLYLIERYRVIEAPARTRFGRDSLKSLFSLPLNKDEIRSFIAYVKSLNKNDLGWVDIYIAPQKMNKTLE